MTTEEPEAPPIATKALDKLDSIIAKATRVHEWLAETGLGPKIAELVAQAWAVRHDMQKEMAMGQQQGGGSGEQNPSRGQPGQPAPGQGQQPGQGGQDDERERRRREGERADLEPPADGDGEPTQQPA